MATVKIGQESLVDETDRALVSLYKNVEIPTDLEDALSDFFFLQPHLLGKEDRKILINTIVWISEIEGARIRFITDREERYIRAQVKGIVIYIKTRSTHINILSGPPAEGSSVYLKALLYSPEEWSDLNTSDFELVVSHLITLVQRGSPEFSRIR